MRWLALCIFKGKGGQMKNTLLLGMAFLLLGGGLAFADEEVDFRSTNPVFKALRASLKAYPLKSKEGIHEWIRHNGGQILTLTEEEQQALAQEAISTQASGQCIDEPCDNGVLGGLFCTFAGCFHGCLKDYPTAGYGRCNN
jgi:hypothetical protein